MEGLVELFIFGRFHARASCEDALGEAVRDVVIPSREEDGCLSLEKHLRSGHVQGMIDERLHSIEELHSVR